MTIHAELVRISETAQKEIIKLVNGREKNELFPRLFITGYG